uniref:Uncharacterized protein n=1 Tax=Cyanistes caeruleus TaxID=156563 RepID=A0A8C0VIR9_CYACU
MNTAINTLASVQLPERCYSFPPSSLQGSFLQAWGVSGKAHPGEKDTTKLLHWQCLRGAQPRLPMAPPVPALLPVEIYSSSIPHLF